jgi:cytidylate kinase
MHFNVITIARTLGAGGEDLGQRLADELGFRYVDDEIIDRAAALSGASAAEIVAAETRHGLAQRVAGLARDAEPGAPAGKPVERSPGYEELIIDVIRETAAMEYVVIVAHGAGIALRGQPGVLRVLVTASPGLRAQRVAAERGIPEDEARRAVEESDAARIAFLERFYGLPRELPEHYDVVFSTDLITIDDAATAIVGMI